jgi:hypothetical protein
MLFDFAFRFLTLLGTQTLLMFHDVFDLMLQAAVHSLRNKILLHLHCINTVIGNSILIFC